MRAESVGAIRPVPPHHHLADLDCKVIGRCVGFLGEKF